MARKSRKDAAAQAKPKKAGMKIWRAALYIRLSVEFNGKKGDSLETQRQIMEAYIALCPDIEIVEVYTDNGTTGRTFEREAFQRMLADVDAGKINCIVVKDLSRLGRNTIDTGYYIEKYFPLHGVRFIAVNDQFDSEDSENSGNHLIVPLKNMINEAELEGMLYEVLSKQAQIILNVADLANAGQLDIQLAKQAEYDKQIKDYLDHKRVLYEQLILKQITMEDYKIQKAAVDSELDRLQTIHSNLKAQTSQMEMDEKTKSARTELAREVVGAGGLTAGLADTLIDRVYVYPNNQVEIVWKMKDFCMEAA